MQVGVGEGRIVGKDPAEWSLKIEHGVEAEEEEGGRGRTCGLGGSLVSSEQHHCGRRWAGEGDSERERERERDGDI